MAIISTGLNEQLAANPNGEYSVLITLKNETLPSRLKDKGKFILPNKIFSARISGVEMQELKNESEIEAIELDAEMGIL